MAKKGRRTNNSAERRRKELERRKAEMNKNLRIVAIVAVIAVIAVVAYMGLRGGGLGGLQPSEELTLNEQGKLQLATTDITGTAKFYSYDADGTEVRFFAVRGSDGKVRIALDACDVCYNAHKGYQQNGDSMQCNNCGNQYETDGIGTKNIKGGCWPSYLPMGNQGDYVIIDPVKLKEKAYMF
jgi:uncharacterized membrane protein